MRLKASGADIFVNITTPKFAAQAIKKVGRAWLEAGAYPQQCAGSIGSVLRPAGLENSKGILTTGYLKDQTDPALARIRA